MLVVHGMWLAGGRLAVWGEDSALPARPPRRPGRPPRHRPHPFAAGHPALAGALGELAAKATTGSALLALPTRDGAPVDSAELVRTEPVEPARGPVGLAAWRVPVLEYDADHALPVLLAFGGGESFGGREAPTGRDRSGPEPSGRDRRGRRRSPAGRVADREQPAGGGAAVGGGAAADREPLGGSEPAGGSEADGSGPPVPGASLRHLAGLAEFAVELVRRGRTLPGLALPTTPGDAAGRSGAALAGPGAPAGSRGTRGSARPGGSARSVRAVWRPLLTGADAGWARALAMALPPAARAALDPPAAGASAPDSDSGSATTRPENARTGPGAAPPVDAAGASGSAAATVADALDALTDAAARTPLEGVRLIGAGAGDAAVRAWLRALTGRQRDFTAEPAAVAELERELRAWQRDAVGSPVRACFRLVEPPVPADVAVVLDPDAVDARGAPEAADRLDAPDAADGLAGAQRRWRVEFALQAADEPSLVVGADRIWAARGELRALARHLAAPQETLLTELGRASRLWPDLDDALRTAAPEALELETEGAHRFLREGAPVLHSAGFGVLLPSWWQRPGARLGARLQAKTRTAPGTVASRSALGMEALVDYEWELALGDQRLSADELRALARLKTPLVRLRGQWVELDAKRLAAGLKLLRGGGELTVGDLLRLGLAAQDDPEALPVLGVGADGPLGDLLAGQAERHLTPRDAPESFRGTLRPYQRRGLAWLAFLQSLGLGGILADDMGLGKTIMLLALLAGDPADSGPTLLVCPMSLVGNWQREAARFVPELRVHVHHGAERPRGAEFAAAVRDADLVLTTYSLAARDAAALGEVDWHRIVVDEAQSIKNAATRQAAAVRSLPARHRVAVTGTPVENRLADLWSIMEFANPGLLGAASAFKKRYAEPIERHGDDEAAARLRRITGPFVLRRVKTDRSIITDLPEKLEMEVLCNLTREQASLYQAVVDDMMARIESSEGIERRGLVLATMTRLKQVCNHPAQVLRDGSALPGRSGKLARLEEILDEALAAGEKALIFTQYAEFGGMLRAHLAARFGREVLFLHGGAGKAERDAMVARFQDGDGDGAGGPALFILSLKAGGTGLTLTAANHVIHVDRWWNPAVEDQATDRAFRIGQRRAVQVRKFVCAGTVEEKVAAMIAEKRGLAARIVGSGEQWLTELSTSELRHLFALESGAVVE
ncbi:SNF2-related protein [Plantactinospora sp. WMMB334]|uniref:SNF2-related protein n=1 Tax=Plantactinospora sp. WMMB334 TaxID=3404119 RepID=UPI003B961960